MNSAGASSVPSEILSSCDLESPAQEAFTLLNNCSNADWNLLLQDGQSMVASSEPLMASGYSVPSDPTWNGTPSSASASAPCVPLYNNQPQPTSAPPPSLQCLSSTFQNQMLPQCSIDHRARKPRHDFISSGEPYLDPENLGVTGGRPSVASSKPCSWSYQTANSEFHNFQQYQPHSDLDSGKTHLFNEIDPRYDLPKLSDFNPEANIINLTGSVTSDILKVVDSEDDESDIIVEDSDTDSDISVTVIDDDPHIGCSSDLSCIVCDVSCKDVAAVNFVHINSSFPLTFVSKTPVVMKLIEFIPFDLQTLVKFENTLICRRCLNLIDTAENLEYRLTNIKQELCNFISKSKPLNRGDLIPPEPAQPLLPCLYQQHQATPCPTPAVMPQNVTQEPEETHTDGSDIDIEDSKTEIQPKKPDEPSGKITREPSSKSESNKNKSNKKGHYQCDRCGRTYLNKGKFSAHMAKHNKDHMLKCQHCFKGFSLEPFLQVHLRTHKDVRKFQCDDCPASFIQESDFKLHTCSESEKRFMCNECPVAFRLQVKLEEHIALNHKRSKHICQECSKEFKNPSSLAAHMKSHTDERKFRCEQCQASYKSLSHLNRHVSNAHNTEKPHEMKTNGDGDKNFECSDCGKQFSDKRYLKQHRHIHEGSAKLNTCPICNKSFRISLKIHMSSHSVTKMFKCNECDSEFTYKQGLMKHVRLKHKKK